jgi:ABC-2 type transport system permease protein
MSATLGPLLTAKCQDLLNSLSKREGARSRALGLMALGGGFWAALFTATLWFFNEVQSVEIFGDVLLEQLMLMVLFVVFVLLLFSNLVASFSSYFLADDLRFLMHQPLPPYSLYTARFLELMVQSSWMALLFSLPVFVSFGIIYSASWLYYVNIIVVAVPLMFIATASASIVSLVLTCILPARRTRELLLLLLAIGFVVLFILFRALQPERFLNPDERVGIVEILSTFGAPRYSALPPQWMHQVLWTSAIGEARSTGLYLGALFSSGAALFFVGAWVFRAMHFDGYSKACEGRPEGSAPERIARRLFGVRRTPQERMALAVTRLRTQRRPIGLTSEMRRKDSLTFIRDTAQWTQLILLGALVVIYLLNFKYIQGIGEGGFIGPLGLYFCNLALAGFVITAISVRFAFPMVSLEGRSFWLIRSGPVTSRDFLNSKWWTGAVPIAAFGILLVSVSNWMIGANLLLSIIAVTILTPATFGVVGMGIGLGAAYPNFESNNAAKIATGLGGFFYMLLGVGMTLTVIGLSVYPTLKLQRWWDGYKVLSTQSVVLTVVFGLLTLILPLVVGSWMIRLGSRRLA